MFKYYLCASLFLVGLSFSIPVKDELMFEGPDDTATVESTVREARAAPKHIGDLLKPGVKDAFLYVYGDAENDDGDVHGYSKIINDNGQDGYKHRDSFHKRDGNKYGYEKHSEFGQEQRAKIEDENAKGIKKAEEAVGDNEEERGESKKAYSFDSFNDDEKKQPKKKVEGEFNYYGEGGEGGDSGTHYSGEGGESSEEEGEGGESSEGGEGEGESEGGEYGEAEESEEEEY